MASKTDIANRALTKLGETTVSDIETENIKPARIMNSMYDIVRDAVLRSHPWNFAIKRKELAALTTSPVYEWDNHYNLPDDFLYLIDIKNKTPDDYEMEGFKILTNDAGPIYIKYIAQITDTGKYDSLFVEAFSSRLAYEACEIITQSNTKKEAAARDYEMAMAEAKRRDAQENVQQRLEESSWVTARYASGFSIYETNELEDV